MATPAETPQKKLAGEERVVSAEKPATKKRREMSTSEWRVQHHDERPRGVCADPSALNPLDLVLGSKNPTNNVDRQSHRWRDPKPYAKTSLKMFSDPRLNFCRLHGQCAWGFHPSRQRARNAKARIHSHRHQQSWGNVARLDR